MGDIRVVAMTNQDLRFYSLIGPFLAQRRVVQELGFPPYDDPCKTWFVALDDGAVAGFVGLRQTAHEIVFCSDYVVPEYRHKGVYRQLMTERLCYALGKADKAVAVVTMAARHCYEQHGFSPSERPKHRLRRYTEMTRSLR